MVESMNRADARRNRVRIINAARAAFADHGLEVSAAAVARHAGVGTATLYRHFPTRSDLIDAVFGHEIEHCLAFLADAARTSDPWQGLGKALDAVVDLELAAPGLASIITTSDRSAPLLEQFNRHVLQDLERLAERVRGTSEARPDLTSGDIGLLLTGVRAIAAGGGPQIRTRCRRFITLITEGVRRHR
ncbi:hypothetical protein GCM10010974_02300 [Brevibacterium sediminis]|uniref:HTH tetR-type domain-containing protein n=1 Tax=Brevibacterium sediminis TaxID=1857024 RepID=A0ABQ1LDT1_9MICO|nr:TetR/AcrR family transcriptional regulator [Brevibacterium sediminis]GGC23191.1 hypothetical protein GCM10010974_02300 [Brevibacterium sediminis]